MKETATHPPAAAAPLTVALPAAVWIALLAAFADVQFVQWTSFSMRPAMIVFSLALDLALFLALALPLTVVAHVVGRFRRSLQRFVVSVAFAGVAAAWLFSRARLAELQSIGPGVAFVVVPAMVALVLAFGLTAKRSCSVPGSDDVAPASARLSLDVALPAVLWAGAALMWMVYLWRAKTASPFLAVGLVLVGTGVNAWWVVRFADSRPWSRVTGFGAVNVLILIAGFPLAPGFDRPYRSEIGAAAQMVERVGESPNIIVIVLDAVRADHMSTYGYEYDTTPQLDAFAATATVLEPGIANATWSLPSHASLLTGLLPHQHGAHAVLTSISQSAEARAAFRAAGAGGAGSGAATETFSFAQRPLAAEHETMAEFLAARGYSTAAIVANFGWVSEFFGLLQGFHYVDNRPMNLFSWEPVAAPYLRRLGWNWLNDRYILLNKSAFFADSIVAHTREWEAQRPAAPFFLLLNFMDAPAPYRASLLTDEFPGRLPAFPRTSDEQGGRALSIARYDRSIAYLDAELGKLFDFLRRRGLFDDSLIVVTSDHGENFDEDRPAAHGADLLQATVAVPLIIKSPRQREGSRPGRVGQLIDVLPTIRETLGIEPARAVRQPLGRSPRAVIAENYFSALYGGYAAEFEGTEDEMLAAFPSRWALFEGPWKLVVSAFGGSELFDLSVDPNGLLDIRQDHPEIAASLERRLHELLPDAAFTTARFPSLIELPDRRTMEMLRSLGYLR